MALNYFPNGFIKTINDGSKVKTEIIANSIAKPVKIPKYIVGINFDRTKDLHNTGIHEFVHLIDKVDGVTDGVPERLIEHRYVMPWLKRIHKEMEAINIDQSDIRRYGGTNEAEFFAVASEYFFENPERMKKKHPELYRMLQQCFHTKQKAS